MKIIPIYSMKKRYICGVLFLVLSVLTACGTDAGGEDGEIQIVESEPIEAPVSTENVETEEAKEDVYAGEYNACDVGEPGLEIEKTEAGAYQILIHIFRQASFDNVSGMLTGKGLEFTAIAPDGSETGGVITLDEDVATVTFDPGWSGFEGVYSFQYYKTSDTPNMDLSAY